MEALAACCLKDVYQEALGSAVIGIDEGQFVSSRGRGASVPVGQASLVKRTVVGAHSIPLSPPAAKCQDVDGLAQTCLGPCRGCRVLLAPV